MYTEIEQATLDIDWYFTNGTYIAFAASGGGQLPEPVAKSQENNRLLFAYFNELPIISKVLVNPELQNVIGSKPDDRYLADYLHRAERGLFAFDRTILNNFSSTTYHLVATPLEPLTIDQLPREIQNMLIESMYEGDIITFSDSSSIK